MILQGLTTDSDWDNSQYDMMDEDRDNSQSDTDDNSESDEDEDRSCLWHHLSR